MIRELALRERLHRCGTLPPACDFAHPYSSPLCFSRAARPGRRSDRPLRRRPPVAAAAPAPVLPALPPSLALRGARPRAERARHGRERRDARHQGRRRNARRGRQRGRCIGGSRLCAGRRLPDGRQPRRRRLCGHAHRRRNARARFPRDRARGGDARHVRQRENRPRKKATRRRASPEASPGFTSFTPSSARRRRPGPSSSRPPSSSPNRDSWSTKVSPDRSNGPANG